MLLFKFWKRVWPQWPATPISYRAKTDKWILLLSGSNFLFLWVDKRNREFFPEKFSQGVKMSFFKNVNLNVYRWRHIAYRKKMIWTLWDKFSWKNFLFRLSTHKKRKFDPLRSKIHLLVFALYEMGVAGQYGHTLFQNLKISISHHFLTHFQVLWPISRHLRGEGTSTWRALR